MRGSRRMDRQAEAKETNAAPIRDDRQRREQPPGLCGRVTHLVYGTLDETSKRHVRSLSVFSACSRN